MFYVFLLQSLGGADPIIIVYSLELVSTEFSSPACCTCSCSLLVVMVVCEDLCDGGSFVK